MLLCSTALKKGITVFSDVKGTNLYLNDERIGTDSATTVISKKHMSNAVLKAKKKGCSDKTAKIETQIDGTTFLGILIDFGVISILMID